MDSPFLTAWIVSLADAVGSAFGISSTMSSIAVDILSMVSCILVNSNTTISLSIVSCRVSTLVGSDQFLIFRSQRCILQESKWSSFYTSPMLTRTCPRFGTSRNGSSLFSVSTEFIFSWYFDIFSSAWIWEHRHDR